MFLGTSRAGPDDTYSVKELEHSGWALSFGGKKVLREIVRNDSAGEKKQEWRNACLESRAVQINFKNVITVSLFVLHLSKYFSNNKISVKAASLYQVSWMVDECTRWL